MSQANVTMTSLGLRVEAGKLLILDQTLLPHEEHWIECKHPDEMVTAIQRLAVRGAPLIGVAAALSIAQYARQGASIDEILVASRKLRDARPTAVNLKIAIDKLVLSKPSDSLTRDGIIQEAEAIFHEDVALSLAMAERGSHFINDGDSILTHCNTGGLATVGIGTALGVVRKAFEQGKRLHVYVDETRPLLQGARLTTWELGKLGIPHTLICDNMAGFLLSKNKVQKIFVGADRIARNGDVANKIGTYSLAVLAHHHHVPFYVVAPQTTYDPECASGEQIPIEQRPADEVRQNKSPSQCNVWNPSFDVTPRELITSIILDDRTM